MAGNSFGELFRITTFGESHGTAIGVVIDGCPAGIELDLEFIQKELERRKPGQSHITTQRKETDEFEILSGMFEGKTIGTPLTFIIRNQDYKPSDYDAVKDAYRPGHADYTYDAKYGVRDYRGGGRSSARETAARVIAGAVAKQIIGNRQLAIGKGEMQIRAYVSQVGEIKLEKEYDEIDLSKIESNIIRCPDDETAQRMIAKIEEVKKDGDTIGGVITCVAQNVPAGLGEPVFDKLHADLAKAMMSINAAHGFEYGSGFAGAAMHGSINNDVLTPGRSGKGNEKSVPVTITNHAGGILGGISNGMDIYFRVAFKPVSTLMQAQMTVDRDGNEVELKGKGRHDPCVLPRAVPIVEAMCAMVLADHLLRNRISKI